MKNILQFCVGLILISSVIASARPNYIGYSGAPGSRGRCASSCHGSGGGTIEIAGFPAEYTLGESYTITISHNGGSSIRQFNGSCRIGDGSDNAGVIFAGENTETYNHSSETNGIKFSSYNQSSGTFTWTAPNEDMGDVNLYIAGQQGGFTGANSDISLTSSPGTTGIPNEGEIPGAYVLRDNYPNPFNGATTIEFYVPSESYLTLDVYNIKGKKVESLLSGKFNAGSHTVRWDSGEYASGIYFYKLRAGDYQKTKSMSLMK